MRNRILAVAAMAAMSLAVAGKASAATVNIINPSFQLPTLGEDKWTPINGTDVGWSLSSAAGGVYNPPAGKFTQLLAADEQVAWSNGAIISQVLSETLKSNTVYTLQIDIGDRLDVNNSGNQYYVKLFAGSTELASIDEGDFPYVDGYFVPATLQYTSGGTVTSGQALRIDLWSNGVQTNFDNVRLDATVVPLPAAAWAGVALMGALGAARARRSMK